MNNKSSILTCHNLYKYFGKFCALDNLNLEIKEGEIFGLLGANGAGKTTLLRCILTLLKLNRGKIYFKDKILQSKHIQQYFGFLPEAFQPPRNLTGCQLLNLLARGINLKASSVDSLLDEVGLSDRKNAKIKNYSRGMIQRLGIAIALLKDPEVLILDEPTLGLDPIGQTYMLELLKNSNSKGKTILFSSHILSQMEKICHRVGIIHKGKLKFVGSINEILTKYNTTSLEDAFLKEVSR
jgi:ABC-2 type transport system ATP-binding protein